MTLIVLFGMYQCSSELDQVIKALENLEEHYLHTTTANEYFFEVRFKQFRRSFLNGWSH